MSAGYEMIERQQHHVAAFCLHDALGRQPVARFELVDATGSGPYMPDPADFVPWRAVSGAHPNDAKRNDKTQMDGAAR